MSTLLDGLVLAGIVGGVQGLFKTMDWFGKKYFEKKEKGTEQLGSDLQKIKECITKETAAIGNSLLQIRNDISRMDVKIQSIDIKVDHIDGRVDENEIGIRNIKEALRVIGRDHCDMHDRDLKIDNILNQK